ncbi:hypothetical protein F5148DRAFT_1247340 [Russula earlei]|uniref:Uncharacterized protein n=1 Tax=Russula earlei TaxID=71964 RepID=A0ACC0TUA8_9AGAM|nr:hypothetical protein F5148DRAFT_1247340 [Russula earlei]
MSNTVNDCIVPSVHICQRRGKSRMRKVEQGCYIVREVRWGMVLDLSGEDARSPIAFTFHGQENQQWEFHSCGAGFIISSVWKNSFLAVRDLKGLQLGGRVPVVTDDFPTCWEVEVMDIGSGAEGKDETEDTYACIRLPHSDMALSFKGGYMRAPLFLAKEGPNMSTCWRLRAVQRSEQVMKNPPISTRGSGCGGETTMITTTSVTTTTRTVVRFVADEA